MGVMAFGPGLRCEFHDMNMTIGCTACIVMSDKARIATLEAELARQSSRRVDEEMRAERAEAELAKERAEKVKAQELAVWAVRTGAYFSTNGGELCLPLGVGDKCDGTPAGILAALERARNE